MIERLFAKLSVVAATVFLAALCGCDDGTAKADSRATDGAAALDAAVDTEPPADGAPDGRMSGDGAAVRDGAADQRAGDLGAPVACDPINVSCRAQPPGCKLGWIPSVVNGCWGTCVPVERCSDVPARPDCDKSTVTCKRVEPRCPSGYVPSVTGSCYGPCVPKHVCACVPGGPATQCPKDTVCWTAKRCGPLI